MNCRQCGRDTANEARVLEREWPLCSRDCAQAFARACAGRELIATWGRCEMWRRVTDGVTEVHLDTPDAHRTCTFRPDAMRADDVRMVRDVVVAVRAAPDVVVYGHDFLERLEARCLR